MSTETNFPPLELACGKDDLRPVMTYVKIDREYTVATDAHMMVVYKTKDAFNQRYDNSEFVEKIPEAGIYIHREDWAKLKRAMFIQWKSDDVLELIFQNKRKQLIEIIVGQSGCDGRGACFKVDGAVQRYPLWKNVIPSVSTTEKVVPEVFTLNADYASKAQKILGGEALKFEMFGIRKGMLCKAVSFSGEEIKNSGFALVMPMNPKNTDSIDTYVHDTKPLVAA